MKKICLLISGLMILRVEAMENNESNELDLKLWCSTLSEVVLDAERNTLATVYPFTQSENEELLFPYGLRTIDPVTITYENKKEIVNEPRPGDVIVLDSHMTVNNLDTPPYNTFYSHDAHKVKRVNFYSEGCEYRTFYDGPNINNILLSIRAYEESYHCHIACVGICCAGDPQYHTISCGLWHMTFATFCENGYISSVLLHRDSNRYAFGMKDVDPYSSKPHTIAIHDISRDLDSIPIASVCTDFVLKRAVYVGKDTYLGVGECGELVSFWLDKHENDIDQMHYAKQTCAGKQFIDIDVDETYKTESGFMPHVALVTNKGEVLVTDLRIGEKPTLFYTRTLENPGQIHRFMYDKGQCAVVYNDNKNNRKSFHVWPDGLDVAYKCIAIKKKMIEMMHGEV